MRAVIQRVKEASVEVEGKRVAQIGPGLLLFLAIHKNDRPEQTAWLAQKIVQLRIFPDEQEKMNLSVQQAEGELLVVSQFTLYGDCTQGRRPSCFAAAPPEEAEPLYEQFIRDLEALHGSCQRGRFGANMQVHLINDGPLTFIVDAK